MIRIRETLLPEQILLNMMVPSRPEAIQKLFASLRSDTRISDGPEFSRALAKSEAARKTNLQDLVALTHVRTSSVIKMLMAFGRLVRPLEEKGGAMQFVVLVGIPREMDAEYLRLVGNLMRVFRNEKLREKLQEANDPAEIIQIFETGEMAIGSA